MWLILESVVSQLSPHGQLLLEKLITFVMFVSKLQPVAGNIPKTQSFASLAQLLELLYDPTNKRREAASQATKYHAAVTSTNCHLGLCGEN
jgi:hypothetical protein